MHVLRDIGMVFLAVLVACMAGAAMHIALGGMGHLSGAVQNSVISAAFYTPLCAFIIIVSMRVFNSPLIFLLLSACAAIVWAIIKTQHASSLKTVHMYGHTLYLDGHATAFGMLYELVTPLTALALGAAFSFFVHTRLRRTA